jgi:hypothetical protein
MSQDFKTVLVQDSRMMVTDELIYAVRKGPSLNTIYPYRAISASNSQVVFNIQVPKLWA